MAQQDLIFASEANPIFVCDIKTGDVIITLV
mgnify:FL=1